jgi:hypothetical protein
VQSDHQQREVRAQGGEGEDDQQRRRAHTPIRLKFTTATQTV